MSRNNSYRSPYGHTKSGKDYHRFSQKKRRDVMAHDEKKIPELRYHEDEFVGPDMPIEIFGSEVPESPEEFEYADCYVCGRIQPLSRVYSVFGDGIHKYVCSDQTDCDEYMEREVEL